MRCIMKLVTVKTKNDILYYMSRSIRNGKKSTTKVVEPLGKHSDLIKQHPDDLIPYLKNYVLQKTLEEKRNNIRKISSDVDFGERISSTDSIITKNNCLNVGYLYLQQIYNKLNLKSFFNDVSSNLKVTYSLNDINRFLTYARILDPKSKLGTYDTLSTYFEQPTFKYQHIERFLPILSKNYDNYIKYLFNQSQKIVSRDTSVCYYDCTNYYFEVETEDDDYIDPVTNELVHGFRKFGPSKEHRPNPIVEMGLFMDSKGIPISMCLHHGSCNEQNTAIPLEKKMVRMFENKKFIYCADAGLGSLNIRNFNAMGGRAFIVTQSIKKLSDDIQKLVFTDEGYKMISNDSHTSLKEMKEFKIKLDDSDYENKSEQEIDSLLIEIKNRYSDSAYKVINVDKNVDLGLFEEKTLKNGKTKMVKAKSTLSQRVIITFSRKMMEYQRSIRNKQIERALQLVKQNGVESKKKGPNDITRFIKRTSMTDVGEVAESDFYEVDQDIIANEEKYDGFYAIATNLQDDSVKEIFEINSKRYQIEDCFRVLKTNFNARPAYHRTRDALTGHFLICYTALLTYRLLENKLKENGHIFTINQIIESLKNMNVSNSGDEYYRVNFSGSKVQTALEDVFKCELNYKNYIPKELRKKFR